MGTGWLGDDAATCLADPSTCQTRTIKLFYIVSVIDDQGDPLHHTLTNQGR